jgi:hypothetical protein
MWVVEDLLTSVCALEARLCEVEARLDEAELAEHQQQSAVDVCALAIQFERVPLIEIDVADAKTTGGGDVSSCGGGRDGSSSGVVVGQRGERGGDERCGVVRRLDARVGGDGALVWWRSVEAIALN